MNTKTCPECGCNRTQVMIEDDECYACGKMFPKETVESTNPEVKVGSLFCMSWGYDQTNLNFFQVTRMTEKGIFVREIAGKAVEGSEGMMCNKMVAVPNSFLSESQWCGGYGHGNTELFRRNRGPSFSIKSRYFAYLTTETEQHYCSWYA